MKDTLSKILFIFSDLLAIALSILAAYWLRNNLGVFSKEHTISLINYLSFLPIYVVTSLLFFYEGIYTKRFDLWQETQHIFKALIFSFFIIMTYLAVTKTVEQYSRAVIALSYANMVILIPFLKRTMKIWLHKKGVWQRPAFIFGNDRDLEKEIFSNPYLGYSHSTPQKAKTVFINSRQVGYEKLGNVIEEQLQCNHEVIFIPLLNDFDLTKSQIYELSNTRTNLIGLQNRLKSIYRRTVKFSFDLLLALLILPILLPIMGLIAYLIKREEPDGSVFFKQERLGKDGNVFLCYKFRTMYEDGEALLEKYITEHPEEKLHYERYHKYKNDPRVTKIGSFLRKTSLDELPQIFNVLKGEMSFIGPRPYMPNEKEKIGKFLSTIIQTRPGITGLWQVSGRSEVDFYQRVKIDVWYIRNWSLWLDIVILLKTFKAVLVKEGAY